MVFLLSILLLIPTTLFFAALLRLKRILDTFLVWALVSFASLVLVFQVANLLHKLNSIEVVLGLQALLLGLSFAAWMLLHRPVLVPGKLGIDLKKEFSLRRDWPWLGLAVLLAFTLAVFLVLIYWVPPNNNDALYLHLTRVLMWKQTGSYFPWPSSNVWQLSFPVNAELTYLWTVLFTNSDHYVAFIPFLAGLATAALVYGLALEFGFRKSHAFFSGLIWLCYPVVLLQLTSVRHDLISTWLFINGLYFLVRYSNGRKPRDLFLSALSMALVVGTNLSIAACLPGLVVVCVLFLIKRIFFWKQFFLYAGMGFVLFGFLSSPIYISNSVYFGSPLPPGSGTMTSVKWVDQIGVVKYLSINMVRWAYQAVDFSAVPNPVGGLALKLKALLVRGFATLIHFNFEGSTASMDGYQFSWANVFPLQEDVAWYGLVGAFLVVPFSIAAFVVGLRKKQYLFSLPLIFLVTSSITCAFIRPGWTPYDGRYFLPVAAIATACFPLVLRKNRISWWIQFIVVVLSACSIAMVLVYNPAKQVVGGSAVWGMNRIDLLTRQTYESKEMLYLVESAVPADAVLGVAARGETIPEYGLFGEKFTRRILEIMDPVMLENAGWLERQGIKYILVYSPAGSPQRIPPGFHYFDSLKDWIVYSNQ